MKKDKVYFTTLDSYLAGFLTIKGFSPELIPKGSKVAFSFRHSQGLLRVLGEYNLGEKVEALQFAIAIKTLKSRIFSMRRDKEQHKSGKEGEEATIS